MTTNKKQASFYWMNVKRKKLTMIIFWHLRCLPQHPAHIQRLKKGDCDTGSNFIEIK